MFAEMQVLSESPSQTTELEDDSTQNLVMNLKNTKYVMKLAWTYSLNLGLVYFFEYFCLTSWADRANLGRGGED